MRNSNSFIEGRVAEELFLTHPSVRLISRSTKSQDIFEHWDFLVDVGGLEGARVDVKSRKRKNRGDSSFMEDQWIEIQNVGGKPGWAIPNGAENRIIAFQTEDQWVLCSPEDLVWLCEREGYQKKTRAGRQDIIMRAPIEHLKRIAKVCLHIER